MDLAWLFPWLLFLHVLGAIVAFGPTFAFSIIGADGWRGTTARELRDAGLARDHVEARLPDRPHPADHGARDDGRPRDQPVRARRTGGWPLAIVLYLIAYGYSFFVQRKYVERVIELTSAPPPPGRERPATRARRARRQASSAAASMLGILIVAIVFLMVVKPTI